MADTTELKLCVLWEGELREAARLIKAMHVEGLDEYEKTAAMVDALNAASVALWGLTDDHACVLIGSDEIRKARKKRPTNTSSEHQP